jgi:hypothetical protein
LTPRVSFEVRIGKGNLIGLFIADLIHYPSGNTRRCPGLIRLALSARKAFYE